MLNTFGRICFVGLAAALLIVTLAPNGLADDWNKKTLITVNKTIEVPGRFIPPGRYVLEIMDLVAERHVVRISDEDGKIYATVIAIPNFRPEATEDTELTFYEAAPGAPEPLRAWFYPNHRLGVEFVYPKHRAIEIAGVAMERVVAENVPEALVKETPTIEELLVEPVIAIEPTGEEVEIAEVVLPELEPILEPVVEPEVIAEPAIVEETPAELPKTATPIPLIALTGVVLAGAALVTRFRNR
jgi:hypothetical protein